MADTAAQAAFDPAAPAAERYDAQAELQQAHAPRAVSDLLPPAALQPVIQFIADQYAEQALLAKSAKVIPFPGRPRKPQGMQSLYLDGLQIFAYGDYFERPTPVGFDALRLMVEQTPILNAVIMTRVRQVCRFTQPQEDDGLGFAIRHIDKEHAPTKSEQASLRDLTRFVTHCGWEFNPRARRRLKRDSFSQFLSKAVRETLTYDSMPIETELKRGTRGGIDGFYAVDGSTIRLCTDDGYDGDDEIFAVQVVQGRVVTAYSHDDLIYEARNPRADVRLAGYGLGETELLIRVVTGFLNALTINLKGFSDNSIPKGILHLTGEYSQEDLAAFRRYWNAMVRGVNNAWTLPILVSRDADAKTTFEKLDAGFDEMMFTKWMTFLVSIICAVYGMSPAEINFDAFTAGNTSALAGSDTGEKLAASKDSGLRPLMAYLESLVSDFIIADFSDKYVFRWAGLDEEDEQRRFEIQKLAMTVNEMRALENLPALAGPLGEAPINPSLIAPWMQLTQGGGDDGGDAGAGAEAEAAPQDAADQPEPGAGMKRAPGASGGGKRGGDGKAAVAAADEPDEPDDDAMRQQLRALSERALGKKLAKANPNHDERGLFSSWGARAREAIRGLLDQRQRRDFSGKAQSLMPVSDQVVTTAERFGLDLSGFSHAADVYGIHHALENHGEASRERARGQIAVTDADFLAIPEVVGAPDYMAFGTKSRVGRDLLVYLKKMPDGSVLYLEEVRNKRHQLALQSVRKYPATIDAASILRADNLNARSDGGDNLIVVDMRQPVKDADTFAKAVPLIWAIEA